MKSKTLKYAVLASTLLMAFAALSGKAAPAQIPVSVDAPAHGFMSVGVYNASDELIRTLSYAKEVDPGAQHLDWDGDTDLGLPAPAGAYHVKGVWFAQPPSVNYKMKIGISGNPPYPTPDGKGGWGGNLGASWTIASNSTDLMMGFSCVESREITGIQLTKPTGEIVRRYNSFFGWDVREACTMDDKNMYMAIASAPQTKDKFFIAKYDLNNPAGKILGDLPSGDHVKPDGRWKGGWLVECRGLALNDDRLYIPVMLDNKLFVMDTNSGQILHTVDIPSPRGVAASHGSVYALSGPKLFKLDADGSPVGSPIIAAGLDDPSGLAIDAATGEFYISDGGAAQQVKVFSAQGKYERAIGLPGGRPVSGPYTPDGMLDPRGLCIGPDGNVWVTEANEDFQRISVWTKQGKLVNAFFNTRISSGEGVLSPDRSEMLMERSMYSDVTGVSAYKIDWANMSWSPAWHLNQTIDQMSQPNVLVGHYMNPGQLKIAFDNKSPYLSFTEGIIKADNGNTYLYGGDFSIYQFNPTTLKTRLASLVYMHRVELPASPGAPYTGNYDQGHNNWLTWADLRGDGKMALDEVTCSKDVALLAGVGRPVSWELKPDLSILMVCDNRTGEPQHQTDNWAVYTLAPVKITTLGAPVYDWSTIKKVVDLHFPDLNGGDGYKHVRNFNVSDLRQVGNDYYLMMQPNSTVPLQLTGIDGDGWWASRNWRTTPMKFDASGNPAWIKMGRRAPSIARPGEMYNIMGGYAGVKDGFDIFNDVIGKDWIWTDDGLYVGGVFNGPVADKMDAQSIDVESVGDYFYDINGKHYLLTGDQGVFVHELQLPQLTRLDGGSVTLTPELVAKAQPWDPDGPEPGAHPTYIAHTIYDFKAKQPLRMIDIDGVLNPSEWGGTPVMPIMFDGKQVAQVQVQFDAQNLYLGYQVNDPAGLRNAGTELPYLPFVSGGYLDFRMGPLQNVATSNPTGSGDVRVILSRITTANDQAYQMGYWPVKANGRNPQTITSPAATRHFDDISPVQGLIWAYRPDQGGYSAEVEVPLKSLGINPIREPVIAFDASVGFANSAGTVRNRAAHWDGQNEAQVVDRPGSAALTPSDWGTLQFERTPTPTTVSLRAAGP